MDRARKNLWTAGAAGLVAVGLIGGIAISGGDDEQKVEMVPVSDEVDETTTTTTEAVTTTTETTVAPATTHAPVTTQAPVVAPPTTEVQTVTSDPIPTTTTEAPAPAPTQAPTTTVYDSPGPDPLTPYEAVCSNPDNADLDMCRNWDYS